MALPLLRDLYIFYVLMLAERLESLQMLELHLSERRNIDTIPNSVSICGGTGSFVGAPFPAMEIGAQQTYD